MTQHKLDDVRRWCGMGACNGQYKTNVFFYLKNMCSHFVLKMKERFYLKISQNPRSLCM